jgi:agmatinase
MDVDGLSPSFCPGTGTPVPGGLSFSQIRFLLNTLAKTDREIIGFDLNEVAPSPQGEWDGNVGARLLYQLIGCMTYKKPDSKPH